MKGAVEKAERVGEPNLLEQPDVGRTADPNAGGRPLAHAVHGQHGRLLEWRTEERARRMREVVLAEEYLGGRDTELTLKQMANPEFVAEPGDHRYAEDAV